MSSKTMSIEKLKNALPELQDFKTPDSLNTNDLSSLNNWRSNEKAFNFVIKAIIVAGVAGIVWYVTPIVMALFTKVIILAGIAVVGLIAWNLMPYVNKWIRILTRKLHEQFITHDPIGHLKDTLEQKSSVLKLFSRAKTDVKTHMKNSQKKALRSEEIAKEQSKNLKKYKAQLEALKDQADSHSKRKKLLQLKGAYEQSKMIFNMHQKTVTEFGSMANTYRKILKKLDLSEISLETKLTQFKLSIESLESRLEASQSGKQATQMAANILGLEEAWEVDYAIQYAEKVITSNISHIEDNFTKILSDVASEDFNAETLLADLESMDLTANDSSKYMDTTYTLSADEKNISGFDLDF